MHQPIREPRASLYHPYTVYSPYFPHADQPRRAPVAIVGGGPIGLTTALILARYGVRSTVFISECQVAEGSRAIVFTKRSMEILQFAGVAERIMQKALSWTAGNSYYKGERVFRMENPQDIHDSFPPLNNLQQNWLETYLVEAAQAQPLIELRWGNRLSSFVQDESGVTVTVDTPEGEYSCHSDWLVAADGARSTIRQQLGLTLEGASYEGRFVIVDIRIDLDLPTERLAFFSPVWNPGNTILMHREPDNIWRFDYQLSADVSSEEALKPENLATAINAQLRMMGYADKSWEMDWASVYSARALTLPDYVHQRVLFAGDAAHLLPIFGVRGANTGFQDAMDLGWKLAAVVKGAAGDALLQTYSADRVNAAREIIGEAGKSTRFMAPPTEGYRLLRDATLTLSLTHEFVRPLFHWRTSRAHAYRSSPLNCGSDDNDIMPGILENGSVFPDLRFSPAISLYDEFGSGFRIVLFSASKSPPVVPAELIQEVASLGAMGWEVSLHVLCATEPGPIDRVAESGLQVRAVTADMLQRRYEAMGGEVYIIRPDHHICARWKQFIPGSLGHYFRQLQYAFNEGASQ